MKIKKPWGSEEIVYSKGDVRMKILTIKPNQQTSLQVHRKKTEVWMVLSGTAFIQRGETIADLEHHSGNVGDSYRVKPGMLHRIAALEEEARIAEVCIGSDRDIVRIIDNYGRGKK